MGIAEGIAEAVDLSEGLRARRVAANAIPLIDFVPFLDGDAAARRRVAAEIGRACREIGLPLLPGVATGSEVMTATADGYSFLKFFPATAAGGIPMLKAFAGPFPDVAFCPTGGITPETAPQFLALPNVRVCGGSWLTPADAVKSADWSRIRQLARDASALRA